MEDIFGYNISRLTLGGRVPQGSLRRERARPGATRREGGHGRPTSKSKQGGLCGGCFYNPLDLNGEVNDAVLFAVSG